MPDTMRLDNVPGSYIVFRNFRGKPIPFTKRGDRSFCLIIPNRLVRDQLTARGCNIKKLKNKAIIDGEKLNDIEFVNVAVRITPEEKVDYIWEALDIDEIDKAFLEFTFHEYNINGKKGTRIYLKNARFCVKDLFEQTIIDIRWPNTISVTNSTNKNNAEETKMNTMTRAEVMGQLQLGITAFEMQDSTKRDPVVLKLIDAMKNAIEYIGEVPKSETKVKTVTVKEKVPTLPGIKQVIFNYPATVVIWEDDVKTVVECQKGDNYDMEKGLAMCICKRMMGNESNFNKQIKKYTDDVKNVQTKKKAKEGTFEERKAARMAQAEANKKAKGNSKNFRGKDNAFGTADSITFGFNLQPERVLYYSDNVPRKRSAPAIVNNDKMVVLSDAYADLVRKRMAKRGWSYYDTAKAAGLCKSTINRYFSPNVVCQKPKRISMTNFKKINKALNIRWRIEE